MSDVQAAVAPAAVEAPSPAPVETAPTPVTIVPEKKETWEEGADRVAAALAARDNPDRDASGRFTSSNAEQPTEAPAEQASVGQAQVAAPEPVKPAIEVPQSWSAEMREHWAKLPPETQEYVSKREAEATKRISELGTTAKYAEGIRNVVERHRGILNGRNEAEAIDAMLHAATRLSQEPYAAIDWLARSYGVDLRHFAASNPTPDGLAPENAQFAHALAVRDREFSALKQTLDETLNRLRASEQRQADIQNQTLTKLIADFAADKPHWSKLEEEIYAQIRGLQELEPGLSHDRMLQKAYEKATWAHPEVRQAIEAEKAEVARKAKVAEDAKKAEEAKRLAALNVKSRHSATPARSGNWENTLDDIANKIARRG